MQSSDFIAEHVPLLPHDTKPRPPQSWLAELRVLLRASLPLILTYLLQYSLPVIGLIFVGRIGSVELAGLSLGMMTANISGYAAYQGLATGLDTLCAQAYGAGNKRMVGVHFQRMVCFMWLCTIPIGLIWFNVGSLFRLILKNEKEAVEWAAIYLKILLFGAPGWAVLECGKRFLQAQGIFTVNLYILMLLAPINVLLHWLFVVYLELGFVGSPIAVVITNNLFAFCLWFCIAILGIGNECWTWPSRNLLFADWLPMVRLALPGFAMLICEWLAFEILTLWAGLFDANYLAAQGTLITIANIGAQMTIPVAIAAATRVANLIGAGQAAQARRAGIMAIASAFGVASFNTLVLLFGVHLIPTIFSLREPARTYVEALVPFVAFFQLLDGANTCVQGLFRGLGSQHISGYIALFVINSVALPLSYVFGFVLNLHLLGLWLGPTIAIAIVLLICGTYLCLMSWDQAVEAALTRTVSIV